MTDNPIAAVYWRLIKKGKRKFNSVLDDALKNDIKMIAANDLMNGLIAEEEYNRLIN